MKKTLSIFIDESGDFGSYAAHSPFYIVTLVFHNQSIDVSGRIKKFDRHIKNLGYGGCVIHTGPLIRREAVYKNELISERKRLFSALYNFTRKLDINYITVKINKEECNDICEMSNKLYCKIYEELNEIYNIVSGFEKIIIYYDNGQIELKRIICKCFEDLNIIVELRVARQNEYRMLQVADLICTIELINEKIKVGMITNSEIDFFDNKRSFKKNYLKYIKHKRF